MKGTTTIAVQPCQHGHVTDEAIWYYRPRQLSLNVRQALEAVVSILRIHRVQVLKHQSQIGITKIATLSDMAVFMCNVAVQLRPQMCSTVAVWICSLIAAVWMLLSECCNGVWPYQFSSPSSRQILGQTFLEKFSGPVCADEVAKRILIGNLIAKGKF